MRLVIETGGAVYEITERNTGGPYPWLVSTSGLNAQARAGHIEGFGASESPSAIATLENEGGKAFDLIDRPIRAIATLIDDDGDEVLAGLVASVKPGSVYEIGIEA